MPMDGTEILRFAGIGFVLGFIGMIFKKFEIGKEIHDLIMIAGYIYMLIFIVQMIEALLTNLRDIFML